MCEAALTGVLLEVGKVALQDELHCIHAPLQYMLERLAAQYLEPKDLRYCLIYELNNLYKCMCMYENFKHFIGNFFAWELH